MKVWFTDDTSNKIAISEDGKVHICDDCPCDPCSAFPTSLLMTQVVSPFEVSNLTMVGPTCAAISPPLPVCSQTPTMCANLCWWTGIVSATRAHLLHYNGGSSMIAERWSRSFCGPSSSDIGFWDSATGIMPYGFYRDTGGIHIFTIS